MKELIYQDLPIDQRKGDPFWRAFCEMVSKRWPDEVENLSTVFI